MKFILFTLMLWSSAVYSQTTTLISPFSLPMSVSPDGKISFIEKSTEPISFTPLLNGKLALTVDNYSRTLFQDELVFQPVDQKLGWTEVRHCMIEGGLGLQAMMKSVASLGLIPYKGAVQTLIRHKEYKDKHPLRIFRLPKELSELESWYIGDSGKYQTYGGIKAYVGFTTPVGQLASASVEIQNQFQIELLKLNAEQIRMKISEIDLKNRQLRAGTMVLSWINHRLSGQSFSTDFLLNLNNPDHHELYQQALSGNIEKLQEEIPLEDQSYSWKGVDNHVYVGLPLIVGKISSSSHYEITEDDHETEVTIRKKSNNGIILPFRNKQSLLYETSESFALIWSSEMRSVNDKVLERNFMSTGRIIGIQGFDQEIPEQGRFGSVITFIGMTFTKEEVEAIRKIDSHTLTMNLKAKCLEEALSCRKERKLKKIMQNLSAAFKKPWAKMKKEIGILLMNEPALVSAMLKTMKLKKEAYFKFQSENFQSLEGSLPIYL